MRFIETKDSIREVDKMSVSVGIDLGTTFSAVAWIQPRTQKPEILLNSDDRPITPSVIQFFQDGTHVCGWEAKDALDSGEENCASIFKRKMGTNEICISCFGKDYTAEDLSALLLAHLKREAEDRIGQSIDSAVITVPAYFFNDERQATIRAAQKAGLKVLRIINEPTSAALSYGLKSWRENAVIMVYDLGGGTFDVTLVGMGANHSMESLGTNGDHILGGKDWDNALAEIVLDKLTGELGINVRESDDNVHNVYVNAEMWKKKLSQAGGSTVCKLPIDGYGTASITVTREEFDAATSDLLGKTISLCELVLKKAGLTWNNVTDTLLVGGSTRMPQVKQRLTELTGKAPIAHVNPDEAVALGAAIQSQLEEEDYIEYIRPVPKQEEKKQGFSLFRKVRTADSQPKQHDNLLLKYSRPVQAAKPVDDLVVLTKRDVQAHGMGIITVNPEGTAYINENIIPPNMPIPIKSAQSFKFFTSPRGDNELEIFVVEGEGAPLTCNINAKYVASGIRHIKGGSTLLRVQYSFDRNSIIHVQVRQEDDCVDLPLRKEPVLQEELYKFGQPIDNVVSERDRLTIILAIDVSGSMKGQPLEDAQNAMISFAKQFEDTGTGIGVLAVSEDIKWVLKPSDDIDVVIRALRNVKAGMTGWGSSAHPFDVARQHLSQIRGQSYIIVLADGQWSCQFDAIRAAQKCHEMGIEVAAIGFGSADESFLNSISSQKDLSILTDQSMLTQSFGKIAQSIGPKASGKKGQDGGTSSTPTWETDDRII